MNNYAPSKHDIHQLGSFREGWTSISQLQCNLNLNQDKYQKWWVILSECSTDFYPVLIFFSTYIDSTHYFTIIL